MLEAPTIEVRLLQHMQAIAVREWQQGNTDVFYIVRNSVNLEGPHKKSDLAMIEREFYSGDLLDEKGFLQLVTSFKTEDSIKAQSQYLRDLDKKLSANASLTQVQVHCDTLLTTWCKIRGNDISLPEAFYHYLLQSFPLPGTRGCQSCTPARMGC